MQECDGYREWLPTLEKLSTKQLFSQILQKINMVKIANAVHLLMLQF